MRKPTIYLADKQAAVLELLVKVVQAELGCEVVGSTTNGLEASHACMKLKPELLLTELVLAGHSGLELIRSVRARLPGTRCIIFSGSQNHELIRQALRLFPHGFVHKEESLQTLREAIAAVRSGYSFIAPLAMSVLDSGLPLAQATHEKLSARERTVLQMVAEGRTSKEIAAELHVAAKTVDHHRARVMQKLALRDIAGLTRYAMQQGLVAS